MDDQRLLAAEALLPESYAVALRMRRAGRTEDAIASALGVPVESIEPLIRLALAKRSSLAERLEDDPSIREAVEDPPAVSRRPGRRGGPSAG